MKDIKAEMIVDAQVTRKAFPSAGVKVENYWTFEAYSVPDENGIRHKKWEIRNKPNIVTTEGLTWLMDAAFGAGTQYGTWYVGICADGPSFAAGDTLGSKSWTEATTFVAARSAVTFGSASAGSIDNTAAVNAFTASGDVTCAGAFLCATSSGNGGVLYAEASFSADKVLANGEVLNVTITCTAT